MDFLKKDALDILFAGINAVKPMELIKNRVHYQDDRLEIGSLEFHLDEFDKVFIIGAGKASASMAREMEKILEERIFYGVVSVKYGHTAPCRKIRIVEAGHPVIDQNSLFAADQILQVALDAGERDLVICLISGGGSALLESLPPGISLADLQKVFQFLLGSGANIEEINTVRKHLSLVKGGQLARVVAPATCLTVMISDVIGDPLESIASGPTAPDSTTFTDAQNVIEKYRLNDQLPPSIRTHLHRGTSGDFEETLKPDDPIFKKVHHMIIGNNLLSLEKATEKANELNYHTMILTSRIQGEAREVAKVIGAITQEIQSHNLPITRPACLLAGGETTVTLRGEGKGGRNQELALAALLSMKNSTQQYVIASCGTDGTDGPTDAAGGIVLPDMWKKITQLNLNAQAYLDENNAYPFLEKIDGLIVTGPTGTNVMDIILILVP